MAEGSQRHGEAEVDEEPYFPTLDDAVEANRASLAGFGQTNHALLRPDVLEGALGRAQNQWYYTGSMANAAAALAHGVGQAQAFEDGNKRTAYWLTHHFLHENDLAHVTRPDDVELANHLVGYGEGTHSMEDTAELFRQRGADGSITASVKRSTTPQGFGFMYHVSPRRNREAILAQGLDGVQGRQMGSPWSPTNLRYGQPPGNYLFDNEDDARDYIYSIHDKDPDEDQSWEDRYTFPTPPEGFYDWPNEEQNDWHDEQEPVERTDDPDGYDIWRVATHGLPMAPDPESALVARSPTRFPVDTPTDLGGLHDEYERVYNDNTHIDDGDMEGLHNEMKSWAGETPRRYFAPMPVDPSRVQLHTHVPSWNLSQEDNYDRLEDSNERQFPQVWDQLPITERPLPGHESNILDPIHDELDPRVWDAPDKPEPVLKRTHAAWIWDTVTTVLENHGYDGMDEWLSLVLTGSLTTYQYSEQSDCDVSLFVDTEVFPEWSRAEMIGIMVGNIDGTKLPGTPHPMQCFVVSPKISKADLYKPGLRSGYDINLGQWVVPPEKARAHDVEREMNEAYTIALENADKMEKLLRYEPDKAVLFWHQIHRRRMRDQRAGKGDYSPSNITYKFLDNRGLFPKIAEVSGEHIATQKTSFPMYKKDWNKHLKSDDPYFYHVAYNGSMGDWTPEEHQSLVDSIKTRGLIPWDEYGESRWEGSQEPRPGHVYLGDWETAKSYGPGHVFRIDPQKLDYRQINPDEDSVWYPTLKGDHPAPWSEYPSLGQWAEATGLGKDRAQTAESLNDWGSVAYRGAIPPDAIEYMGYMPQRNSERLTHFIKCEQCGKRGVMDGDKLCAQCSVTPNASLQTTEIADGRIKIPPYSGNAPN